MRYTVVWMKAAEDELARLWTNAPDQQAVADATNRIEKALQHDPDLKGRPQRFYRTYVDLPLGVLYHVSPDDRMVRIIWVVRR